MPHDPHRMPLVTPVIELEMRTCRWCKHSYDADDPADVLWHRPGGCTTP